MRDTSIRPRNGFSSGEFITFNRLKSKSGKLGDIRVSTMSQGLFLATKSASDSSNPNGFFVLRDYKGSFPVEVSYTGVNSDPYLLSLDDETLRKESPLKILGICTYSAIYTSIQRSDSSSTPFVSSQMYPDYSPFKVRAAAPLPVHIHVVNNYTKPVESVHVLDKNEYEVLVKSVASSGPKTPVVNRTTLFRTNSDDKTSRKSVASMLGNELE